MMNRIPVPKELNYVAAFLSLDCNHRCVYCINRPGEKLSSRSEASAATWLSYLNRLELPDDLPISFQGGEPSRHPEFFDILNGVRDDLHVDLLTNLSFNVDEFTRAVAPRRFLRKSPYASIRVTYHPGQSNLDELLEKFVFLQARGYPVGLYSIEVPGHEALIQKAQERTKALGIDHRTKEYLGRWRGQIYGTYHYPDGLYAKHTRSVSCRTTELLMAPDGKIFRCHRDLYVNENPVGDIASGLYVPESKFRACDKFGNCNPCDLKRKTNRFQIHGHASVEVRFESPEVFA